MHFFVNIKTSYSKNVDKICEKSPEDKLKSADHRVGSRKRDQIIFAVSGKNIAHEHIGNSLYLRKLLFAKSSLTLSFCGLIVQMIALSFVALMLRRGKFAVKLLKAGGFNGGFVII